MIAAVTAACGSSQRIAGRPSGSSTPGLAMTAEAFVVETAERYLGLERKLSSPAAASSNVLTAQTATSLPSTPAEKPFSLMILQRALSVCSATTEIPSTRGGATSPSIQSAQKSRRRSGDVHCTDVGAGMSNKRVGSGWPNSWTGHRLVSAVSEGIGMSILGNPVGAFPSVM